uniref:Uncharacterized protein n=1 Tax=Oryza meridionalis TaxID=40149 RepID=A0A0E0EMY1_9ORYZ
MVQSLPARGAAGRRKKMGTWMSLIVVVGLDDGKTTTLYKLHAAQTNLPQPDLSPPWQWQQRGLELVGWRKRWETACWGLEGVRPVENGMEAETEGARRQLRLLH